MLHPDLCSYPKTLYVHFLKTAIDFPKHQGRYNTNITQHQVFKVTHIGEWNWTPSCTPAPKPQLLQLMQLVKARNPKKSADNQLLPTAPSWLGCMCRNVMVNGNQSKLLGLGAAAGPWMEENKRENVPLIWLKTDPRPADTVAAVASSTGSKQTSFRARGRAFRGPFIESILFWLNKWDKGI